MPTPGRRHLVRALRPRRQRGCAITEGTPSTERFTLLQRQALELSLYTLQVRRGRRLGARVPAAARRAARATARSSSGATTSTTSSRRPLLSSCPSRAPRVGALGEIELDNILRLITQPRTYAVRVPGRLPTAGAILVLDPALGGA